MNISETNVGRHTRAIGTRVVEMYTLTLWDSGILQVRISAGADETLETQRTAVVVMGELTQGRKVPVLYIHDPGCQPNHEVRENWAKTDTCPYSRADAFMTKSLGLRILGNFYLNFHKPGRPTKLFTSEESALQWLQSFL